MNNIDRMTTVDGILASEAPVGTYVYRIKSLQATSSHLGPCEVCGMFCAEVHLQVEGVIYEPGRMTYYDCTDRFGHKDCLIAQRKTTRAHK